MKLKIKHAVRELVEELRCLCGLQAPHILQSEL